MDNLLFRRQFIMGSHFVETLRGWKKLSVRDSVCLTVHPDLMTTQKMANGKSITLLGYILDAVHPQATDKEIIDYLLMELLRLDNIHSFIELTYHYGGRWILILDDGNEVYLFSDALGFRQIYYTVKNTFDVIWCASQTGIMAETLNLKYDYKTLEQFTGCYEKEDGQYWWPNDQTPFKEIKHLLPNHYLKWTSGLYVRYWPNQNIPELSLEEGIKKGAKLLKGIIESAANRYELAFTITAGIDTRLLLAASKELRQKFYYFTMMYWNMTKNSLDVLVPSRLLAKLGIKHHVIKCPHQMKDHFKEIYNRNVPTARMVYGTIAQGLFDQYPMEKICVKGNGSAVAKYKNMRQEERENLNGMALAKREEMGKNCFAAWEFDKWLGEAKIHVNNLDILTLFYWEQRIGNWQGMSQTEWDIVMEIFDPCNCRSLLITLLATPEEYRKGPEFILFQKLMQNMWPEVLREPINPEWKRKTAIYVDRILKTHVHKIFPKRLRRIIRRQFYY